MTTENAEKLNGSSNGQQNPEFAIQRIYVKDISFESPSSPKLFKADWKPVVNLDLHSKFLPLEQGFYEVVLLLTVTAKLDDQTAFVAEVKQAGIFTINHFPEEQLQQILGNLCLSILFPYAREVISDLVTRGGFPPLYLAPINFDVLYQQHLARQQHQAQSQSQNADQQ